ncbi:MAG: TonB-dependent receptor [Myxococcaceae bacterium]
MTSRRPLVLVLLLSATARAGEDGGVPRNETTVVAPSEAVLPDGRAGSVVRRSDLDRRLPRSTPDALRFEPGVFIQQTAAAQASAIVRGLTGQQTLMLFDGIRLNNSTYRQGPNQYLFTIDPRTVEAIELQRGGGSTRYGSDALGGVLLVRPLSPPVRSGPGGWAGARVFARGATADTEAGGRVQLTAGLGERLGFVGGVGARRVGLLRSGGPVLSPANGLPPEVPRFGPDGRTQLGTGFGELTADARAVLRLPDDRQLTTAGYLYRQTGAPRTDQCPPPSARFDECLFIDEQLRALAYAAYEAGPSRATLSWQRQRERRRGVRPASFVYSLGDDDVDTLGATFVSGAPHTLAAGPELRLQYGADVYLDLVRSSAAIGFTDIEVQVERSRGQYLDGSLYLTGGAFVDAELALSERLELRAGGRVAAVTARAPADAESGSTGVDRWWLPLAGHLGIEWEPADGLFVLANLDRSFRAPNLDDLTSRQQTGPGFQFENPALAPEAATTAEVGGRLRRDWLSLDLWAFETFIEGAVGKRGREAADCPPQTLQCQSSWARYQLVNARELSSMRGLEAAARLRLPVGLTAQAMVAWTWGEGPNLADPPSDPAVPFERRVPLSRVPPLNGTVELGWAHGSGLSVGGAFRWAGSQQRLAVADRSDARIPLGGTPGYAVVDARLGYRYGTRLVVAAVLENVLDTPYRSHGSSVNGPGRGVVLSVEGGLP